MLPTTPCLMVDEAIMTANIRRMAEHCRTYGCALRPHVKTHKCVDLAKLQLAEGADGITIAKISEAEVMAAGGIDDILAGLDHFGIKTFTQFVNLLLSFD